MLRLRATRPICRSLSRLNSTVAPTATESTPAPPPPTLPKAASASTSAPPAEATDASDKTSHGRRKPGTPRRSPAARGVQTEWNRPLAPGVIPAYDEALKLIRADSRALKAELEGVTKRLGELKDATGEEVEALKAKAHILEVQSEINLPDVRWKSRNGQADMSKAVYRRLAEQRWRGDGALDLLMERIHQMNVVPDVIPDLRPSFDLRVSFPQYNEALRYRTNRVIEPGVFLEPKDTIQKPRLYTTVFHHEPRLYTLLMIDPDVPNPESQSFSTYLHWMQPNISLSSSSTEIPLPPTQHTPYIPPHPQKGTKYHRYVILLLPHPDPSAPIEVPEILLDQRENFDVRAFCAHYGLDGAKGGATHMWREVWSEDVSKMYGNQLAGEEPKFGRPRKPDLYAEVKKTSKYMVA